LGSSSVNFNPARILSTGKPVEKVNSYKRISFNIPQQEHPTDKNIASLRKKVVDTYSPSSENIEAPLTIYNYNRATKTINKINIIDKSF